MSNISGVINIYTPVLSVENCTRITVLSSVGFSSGDTVLLIQMKGASIDVSNTSSFGSVINYNNSGNYEFVIIDSVSADTIIFKNGLLRNYDPFGKVQMVSVPRYSDAAVVGTLSANAWNGTTGGVLVFEVDDTLVLNADVNMSGLGFRGGVASVSMWAIGCLVSLDYYYTMADARGGQKGEGIVDYISNLEAGQGALANGGGGGNNHNAGGGGGGNCSSGGKGGYEYDGCNSFNNGGVGGYLLQYSNATQKTFLGGGGGGGHRGGFGVTGTPGTCGGGIIIIKANTLVGNGYRISSNGIDQTTEAVWEGAGGGGSGGTILLDIQNFSSSLNIEATGGRGGDNDTYPSGGQPICHGTGGGGSGGLLWVSLPSLPGSITTNLNGGNAGLFVNSNSFCYNTTYGAIAGLPGFILTDLTFPINTFNIALSDTMICLGDSIQFNVSGGTNYLWSPGTSLSDSTISNPIAFPDTTTTYQVIASDISGCIFDTAYTTITVLANSSVAAGPDTLICIGDTVQLYASGGQTYSWSPATGLSCTFCNNPIAHPESTTIYTVTASDSSGCSSSKVVAVIVKNDESCYKDCDNSLMVPNAFSPNGDGMNDLFRVQSQCVINYLLRVYNRWGQLMWETTDIMQGWDGKYKDKLQEMDVYVYYLNAVYSDGETVFRNGDVTLVK